MRYYEFYMFFYKLEYIKCFYKVELFIPDVKCPEQTLPPHTYRNTDLRFVNGSVEYTCEVGYYFSDGTDRSSSFCKEDQTWSHEPPSCNSKCTGKRLPELFSLK